MSATNWGFLGGGGAKYFFSGPKCPPSNNWRHVRIWIANDPPKVFGKSSRGKTMRGNKTESL